MALKIFASCAICLLLVTTSSLQSVVRSPEGTSNPHDDSKADVVSPLDVAVPAADEQSTTFEDETIVKLSNPRVEAWLKEIKENNPDWERDLAGWMNAPKWIKQ